MNRMWRDKVHRLLMNAYPRKSVFYVASRREEFEGEDRVVALVREAYIAGMRRAARLAPGAAASSTLRARIKQAATEEPDW